MLRISFDGDDRGIFLGLKFSTLVFFWFGKFWFTRRFFCVFKTIWRCHCAWCYWWNRRCSWVSRVLMARRLSLIFCMGFFRRGGLIFLQGFFVKPNGFYSGGRVDFCPHSRISVTWNPEYPLPLRTRVPQKKSLRSCYIQNNSACICSRKAVNLTTVVFRHSYGTSARN